MATYSKSKPTNPVYTHQFAEAFSVGKEQVDEIAIRKPTGLDMVEIGSPVLFDSVSGKAELDMPICYRMLARLADLPEVALYRADPGEMLDLFWMTASFFMNGRQTLLPELEKRKAELRNTPGSPEPSPDASIQDSP